MAGWCHVPFCVFGKKLAIGEDNRKALIRQKAEATAQARSRHLPGVPAGPGPSPPAPALHSSPSPNRPSRWSPEERATGIGRSVLGSEGKGIFLAKGNGRPVALEPRGQRAARHSWARNVSQASPVGGPCRLGPSGAAEKVKRRCGFRPTPCPPRSPNFRGKGVRGGDELRIETSARAPLRSRWEAAPQKSSLVWKCLAAVS